MTLLEALKSQARPERAKEMAAYHKVEREYLGLSNPEIETIVKPARKNLTPNEAIEEAQALWVSNIYEARVAAGKLMTRGKMLAEDSALYWRYCLAFAPDFDSWAIADHMAMAAHKRLFDLSDRYKELEAWTRLDHLWQKRAALVYTLPICRISAPSSQELLIREEIIGWAARYVDDGRWFIQKAIAWWMRDLSKKDPKRVLDFLSENGEKMKAFARKEAGKYL